MFKERDTPETRFTVNIPIDRFCFNKNLFVKAGNYSESFQQKSDKICGALRDLVPCAQFKKRKRHPWKNVNFSKVAGFSLQLY